MERKIRSFIKPMILTLFLLSCAFFMVMATDAVAAADSDIDHYHVVSASPQLAGREWTGTATAHDASNNEVTVHSDITVTMTAVGSSTLFYATSGGSTTTTYTLASGTATFSFYAKDVVAESIASLRAQDTAGKFGTIGPIVVNAGAITHYEVISASPQLAGREWTGTVTAHDAYDNLNTSHVGGVAVTMTATGSATTTFYATSGGSATTTYTLLNGLSSFSFFARDTNAETITALHAASSTPVAAGNSGNVVVNAGAINHYHVDPSTAQSQLAGRNWIGTVTGVDQYNNLNTTHASGITVTMTNSTGHAFFFTDGGYATRTNTYIMAAFSSTFTFYVNDVVAETLTLTATSTSPAATGTSAVITVNAGIVTHYDILVSGWKAAGTGFTGTIQARDANDNVNTTAANTLTMYVSGNAILYSGPSYATPKWTCTLVAGIGTIYVKDMTAETNSVTAQENPPSSIFGYCDIVINAAALHHFTVTGIPSPVTAGNRTSPTVTAYDVYGNINTTYTGTIRFTSTDANATSATVLPSDYTFLLADHGEKTFTNGVRLTDTGSQTVTVTSILLFKTGSQTVNVNKAAALDHFTVTGISSPVVAGVLTSPTVTAYDVYNNINVTYVGTIHFTSTDANATFATFLPSDYVFRLADAGVHTFTNGVKLTTTGTRTVTVTSILLSKTGSQTVTVTAAALDHFTVTGIPSPVVAGVTASPTITACDVYNNTNTTYVGTIHFTSNDANATSAAILPSDYTFILANAGAKTFNNGVKLTTAGTRTVTVTSILLSKTGSQTVTVTAAALDHFTVTGIPSPVFAGNLTSPTVTACDVYNNIQTTYTGRIHFTSTDTNTTSGTILPSDYTFILANAGVKTFTNGVRLTTAGSQNVTVTSTAGSKTGSQTGIIVYSISGAPALTAATAGSSQTTIIWTAPANTGFAVLTGYKVYYGTTSTPGTLFSTVSGTTLSVSVIGLTPGTLYYFGVKAVNIVGDSVLSNVLSATPYTVPNAPTLTAATAGSSQTTLTWTAPANTGFTVLTGYKVFYGTTSTPGTLFSTVSGTTLSATVTGLAPGTLYYFAVKAVNIAGDSVLSNVLSATPYTVPNAPTLTAATAGSSQATLTWTAPANTGFTVLTGYKVFYGTIVPDTQFGVTLSASTLTVDVTSLTPGIVYYFAVKAVNIAGDSVLSNVLSATPYTVPNAPTLTTATAGSSQATLTWTAPTNTGYAVLTGYKVFYGTTSTPGTLFTTVGGTTLSAAVTGLSPGTLYYFAVKAVNAAGDSPLSNILSATPYTVPNAPTLTTATAGINSAVLVWTAPTISGGSPVTGYKVFFGTIGPTNQFGVTLPATTFTVSVTDLEAATLYHFAVKAVNAAGDSILSNERTATPYGVPNAPTLTTATSGSSQGILTWTAPSFDGNSPITGYRAYYGTSTPGTLFSTVSNTTLSVAVTGLIPGTLYYFAVKAVNIAGDSILSNVLSATPYTVSNAPTLTTATAGSSQATLTWTAPANTGYTALTGYKVFYGTAVPDTQFGDVLPASTLTVDVTSLTPGTVYYFAVKAVNIAGDSVLSNVLSATPYTVSNAPTLATATAGSSQATLIWTAPANTGYTALTGYKVFYGTAVPDTQFGVIISASTLTVNVTGLTPGIVYHFAVKAVNIAGDSVLSNELTAIPYTLPGAPTLTAATPGVRSAVLSWTAPASDGSTPITGYKVYYGMTIPDSQFGDTLPATTLTVRVTGLTDDTMYYFAVKAVNIAGDSSYSNVRNATTNSVPGMPTELGATAIYDQVTLIWNAPFNTGGDAITHYNVYRGLSSLLLTYVGNSTTTTYVDASALAGTTYHYRVSAVNGVGEGARSTAVSILVPTMLPVTGRIVDGSGNGLAGIKVALETGLSVQTDAQGNFTIMASPGNHTMTVSGQGIDNKNMAIVVSASGLVLGNISTTKATDYVFIIVIVVIIAAVLVAVLLLMRKRKK